MKISTRIGLGLSLLVVLFLGASAYQLSVVQKLEGISRELSGIRLEASRAAIVLIQEVENVREFAAKSLLLGDPDYAAEWQRAEDRFVQGLDRLSQLPLGDAEGDARLRVLQSWASWSGGIAPLRPDGAGVTGLAGEEPGDEALPSLPLTPALALEALDEAEPYLTALLAAAEDLLAANDARVTTEAGLATEAAGRARMAAWIGTAGGVTGALLVGLLLWGSIHGPLRRLTQGTRELARGRFEHRIPDRSGSEFGALARDFNHMAEQLGELEELKQDFVSHVSHELKGPLAAIQETILVLLEELPGPVNEKQRSLLELSRGSSARLSRMISDLLEVSRQEAGAAQYDPAPVPFGILVAESVSEMGPLARERGMGLDTSGIQTPGTRILADGDRLREVVANLVGNAIKFAPARSVVEVRSCFVERMPSGFPPRYQELEAREGAPYALLEVLDQGPGVAPEHREGIFEKFHQVSIDGRKQGQGVGLGLAIARRIVEGHGGAIWVDEGEGPAGAPGACFRVVLPVRPSRWVEVADSLDRAVEDPPREGHSREGPQDPAGSSDPSEAARLEEAAEEAARRGCEPPDSAPDAPESGSRERAVG
jgi:signal transduction histidine kinase